MRIERLTPAPAGKTFCRRAVGFWIQAHPRACGENREKMSRKPAYGGSPPRLRGKPMKSSSRGYAAGLTPAPAGKTAHINIKIDAFRAHPRACGENPKMLQEDLYKQGSPPRLRGKPMMNINDMHSVGLTPAPAGKTSTPYHRLYRPQAHPRACGENFALAVTLCPCRRLTPAPAGKTCLDIFLLKRMRAHPRACGENIGGLCFALSPLGSPPRLRGKPRSASGAQFRCGLTPAPAGKTGGSQ